MKKAHCKLLKISGCSSSLLLQTQTTKLEIFVWVSTILSSLHKNSHTHSNVYRVYYSKSIAKLGESAVKFASKTFLSISITPKT